ncbi:glycosyltransferase family 2 protein [Edwardsiella tarda]|uniref:glycosyltransferase family 2 protein n=1 Tax=Edwardsiella tarda TaxID=636 RepID=UPI00069AA402|nr:glycosyltransferase [Edwardsiella tarda]UBU95211.1 hypothetical protein AAW15_10665 [Edwardsiella tarda]
MLKYLCNFKKVLKGLLLFDNLYNGKLSRDQHDKFVEKVMDNSLDNKASISAIYRVKNGQAYIQMSILSIAPFVEEIIVIDNNSSDLTVSLVKELQRKLSNIVTIKIYSYSEKLCLAGDSYLANLKEGRGGSLADYYNYCFGLGSKNFLMKVDAHYIFFPNEMIRIVNAINSRVVDYITYRGVEIYGKDLSKEAFIFRRDINWRFIDGERFEYLQFDDASELVYETINHPVFLHTKRLTYSAFLSSAHSTRGVEKLYGVN